LEFYGTWNMNPDVRILVVEDHFATLDGLVAGLAREPCFEVVGGCANSDEGLELAVNCDR